MTKWVKRPVMIDAVRFCGLDDDAVPLFDTFDEPAPTWLLTALKQLRLYVHRGRALLINSPEGVMVASTNDYIIRGIKGELYPCKPDIFEHTHQRAA